jgi:quinoprotein glucose dehydrogenase
LNAANGQVRWQFDAGLKEAELAPGAWKRAGAANNWAGMALDARRDIVYMPTGPAVGDRRPRFHR